MAYLSLGPQTYDIAWDGISCKKITFTVDTNLVAGPYTAKARRVFGAAGQYAATDDGEEVTLPYSRGEVFFTAAYQPAINTWDRTYVNEVSLSVASSANTVTVSLSPLIAHAGDYGYMAFAWQLVAGGDVLVRGRIDKLSQNPFAGRSAAGGLKYVTGAAETPC